MKLTAAHRAILEEALGIGCRELRPAKTGYGFASHSTPWRNRKVARNSPRHDELDLAYHLVRDEAADYGTIKVYRVTPVGAQALGLKLPKKLFDLIPRVAEPLKLAA